MQGREQRLFGVGADTMLAAAHVPPTGCDPGGAREAIERFAGYAGATTGWFTRLLDEQRDGTRRH